MNIQIKRGFYGFVKTPSAAVLYKATRKMIRQNVEKAKMATWTQNTRIFMILIDR